MPYAVSRWSWVSAERLRWSTSGGPKPHPRPLGTVSDAEELGAVWEGDNLVTYDIQGFRELFVYYENDDYMIDND